MKASSYTCTALAAIKRYLLKANARKHRSAVRLQGAVLSETGAIRACLHLLRPSVSRADWSNISLELVTTQLSILRSQKSGLEIDCLTTVWLRRAPLSSVRAPGILANAGI